MKYNWFYSLRFRILAGCVTGLLVLFALVIFNTSKVLDEFAVENTRTLIKQTSETLNLAVVPQTTEVGLNNLEAYLNEMIHGDENGIIYLTVLDENDHVLAASRSVPDPLPDTAIKLEQQLVTDVVHVEQPILLADNRIGHLHYGLSTVLLKKTNARLIWENLYLFGGGLTVVFIMLIVTGRRIGAQLDHLVSASQMLADGDYESRAVISGHNEFSYLAHNFNLMAEAVAERNELESELRQSDKRFQAMFEESLDGIIVADVESKIFINANSTMCSMTGYDMDELLSLNITDLHPEADLAYVLEQFEKQARGEIIVAEDIPVLRKDGSIFLTDISVSHLEFDGRPYMAGFFRDITERKVSDEALRNSEERQRAITSAFPDLVFLFNEDGKYVDIISNADDLLYAEPSELLGKTLHQVIPAKDADKFFSLITKTLKTGESQSIEYYLQVPRGMVFFEGRTASVGTLIQGKQQVVFVARDVSERHQAEMDLIESQSKYRGIFNESVAAIYVFDKDKNFIDTNDAGLELMGYSREELLNMSISDVDADAGSVRPSHEHLLAGGRVVNFEHRLICKNGRIITVLNNSRPLTDREGVVTGMQSTLINITERKQAEHELETHRLHLEELVTERTATVSQQARIIDQSHDSIVTTDLDGIISSWNMGAEKLFGIKAADAIGEHIAMTYPTTEHDFLQQKIIQPLQLKGQYEAKVRMWRADHSVFDAHLSLSMMYDDDGEPIGMISYCIDISEGEKIENALRESEANLARAQSIAHVGSWHFNVIDNQLRWSGETHRIFGLEENMPVTPAYFSSCIHPEDSDYVLNAWAEALHGAAYDIEHRIIINGEEKWVREQAKVQFDTTGLAISALGTVQDISEHKAIEQALAEARQKAEVSVQVKSEFLANMSHEIRTPLNAVLGFARMGLRDSLKAENRRRFSHILDSGQHLLGVINDILDLSKMDVGKLRLEKRPFRLVATVEDALNLITEQARVKDVVFSTQLATDLPAWVTGDSLRLRQVLLNLLSNAIKFTEKGKVNLSVAYESGKICFTVRDTGIGMNSEQISRLFTPFDQADSSTTRKYGGSGLGLTISQTLAHLMGGSLTVESEQGKGSTFTLTLPLSEIDPVTESVNHSVVTTDARLKGVHVLVAEDVELNQIIIQDMLDHEGAQVVFAENGLQVLDRLEELGVTAFDIVLMDVQMPVMDGYEATRRVLEIAPALPVIGLTAHAMIEERDKCAAAGMVEHIAKPVNIDALVEAIKRQLVSYPAVEQETPVLTRQETPPETTAVNEIPPDFLPGFNMEEGLERLRGKWSSYKKLLLIFYKQYKNSADTLASLLAQGELEEASLLAHSLKGVSGTLGAMQFYEQAAVMEEACNSGDIDAANAHMALFRSRLKEIIDGLAVLDKV